MYANSTICCVQVRYAVAATALSRKRARTARGRNLCCESTLAFFGRHRQVLVNPIGIGTLSDHVDQRVMAFDH